MSAASNTNGTIPDDERNLPIAIVGGGLGGLALAIGLVRHGVRVHIYEAAPVFAEIGAGVAFGVNSTRALQLLEPRLLEGYKKYATFNEDRARDRTFLTFRWGMDERKRNGRKAGDFMWHMDDVWNPEKARQMGVRTRSCIHRARLLDILVALLPQGIASFGKRFEGVDEQADGTLRLHFADGTDAFARAMVGCDGIRSKTRDIVCGSVQPRYIGETAFRAMVPRAEAEKALGSVLAANGQLYCGYGGYIVTYPVENGQFTNMIAMPHDTGDVWNWADKDWTVPAAKGEFLKAFEAWYPPLVNVIQRYHQNHKWALFNMAHTAPYHKGRMCLLGDSAHATTPHLGAGAGMAMEDAYILSNLIAYAKAPEDAFRAYDAVRRPRTQQLIENSRVAGLATDFMMPDVGDNTDALKRQFEAWYKWLWHEDLEAQLQTAKKLL